MNDEKIMKTIRQKSSRIFKYENPLSMAMWQKPYFQLNNCASLIDKMELKIDLLFKVKL